MNTATAASAALAGRPAAVPMSTDACEAPGAVCSHSLGRRLSRKLALFTMVVLGLHFAATWSLVAMQTRERNAADVREKSELMADILSLEARSGGEAAVLARLASDAPMRARSRLEVWRSDGQPLYADPAWPSGQGEDHLRSHSFEVVAPGLTGGRLQATYTVDFANAAEAGRRWGWALVLLTLSTGALVALGVRWHVRRQVQPLLDLAAQTRAISPGQLHRRLSLADPASELLPWIEQFNALMARLDQAYAQLEGFNADVAHELRTPLATLMGQTELALTRDRSADSLRETLVSNLEEMQRMSAMVNDMLFLSQADRGAVARRGAPVSLAELVRQVLEFHEAPMEDAGLSWRVQGDALVAVDEPLFKRAVSNLLGNATRFARPGTSVDVVIEPVAAADAGPVRVLVRNVGDPIDARALPRLFDRFFRVDSARCCEAMQHHGLGLAIVSAIARMHAGSTVAESMDGVNRIGFTLARG